MIINLLYNIKKACPKEDQVMQKKIKINLVECENSIPVLLSECESGTFMKKQKKKAYKWTIATVHWHTYRHECNFQA